MEYMDLLLPTAPSLIFAHETCMPYILLPLSHMEIFEELSQSL